MKPAHLPHFTDSPASSYSRSVERKQEISWPGKSLLCLGSEASLNGAMRCSPDT